MADDAGDAGAPASYGADCWQAWTYSNPNGTALETDASDACVNATDNEFNPFYFYQVMLINLILIIFIKLSLIT